MASLRTLFVLVVVLFAVIHTSTAALSCYTCNTKEACSKTEGLIKKPCATDAEKCSKLNDRSGNTIEKGCMTEDNCKLYYDCNTCSKDDCNSSSVVMPSFLVFGVAAVILAKYCL